MESLLKETGIITGEGGIFHLILLVTFITGDLDPPPPPPPLAFQGLELTAILVASLVHAALFLTPETMLRHVSK